ncbi:uncharacterized protein LOC126969944 isoform X1 [Leptidea sinapis]|uniref:Borealin C-terminal domain-containing protein n=1 Tax=Leptidea sinapis TaxID=189913 RepID=A0A5E4Q8Q0_9NEOP|nr:uncharacterized protein LOC126969944 isoform X1 [Leptidea sinapis]VVC94667.1 unnamed protein product [Leptidea sinapis]
MPRTKRPAVRRVKSVAGEDETEKEFKELVREQNKKMQERGDIEISNLEISLKILLGSLKNHCKKTIGQLRMEQLHLSQQPTTRRTRNLSRSTSHDDGYLTENSSQGSADRGNKKTAIPVPASISRSASRTTSRRSRSADASARLVKQTPHTAQRRRSKSAYRTPAYNKNSAVNYPAITPKVTPHTSLAVLRQPRQGEMVVSMSGSPVMVPSWNQMQPKEKANCNIMLQDGTMLSLQPKQLRQSQAYIPFSLMDKDMLHQLRTLKDNLDKVVKLGEKAMK